MIKRALIVIGLVVLLLGFVVAILYQMYQTRMEQERIEIELVTFCRSDWK